MELRWVIREWDSALARLADTHPDLAAALARSCRPMAAERRPEGQLLLVLGCWWQPDLTWLRQPATQRRLDQALSRVLSDQLTALVERWPAGFATAAEGDEVHPPDLLAGVAWSEREAASACESPLQRHFFAAACRRGLRLQCQYRVLIYRLDFAVPADRLGVEVDGWERPASWRGRAPRREREQHLGANGWRVLRFWGKEVLDDVDACVEEVWRALRSHR